ncbi:hypothetical protein BD324DRAFT_519420 [Kockovaella imperatae]|uniref:GATA-type domain-containing protein n=1 Tax=Kockovaella imperatae TaxID=4999 RepID=A0A1Y1UEU3_9TREE|nr:hypothetical protein BD324DRAFT_519420 [Kockovaella imperatae]ORX36034.1 hypothetical protein BD324DRAFT_519420 [Kockovaella imperatae]
MYSAMASEGGLHTSEDGPCLEYDTPPNSPPLQSITADEATKFATPVVKPESERKPGEPRFPSHNAHGDKQCINCQETDTPQWRSGLCNACALWKRSRGTDRPLPLLFPIRKRPESPSPPSDDEDEVDASESDFSTEYGKAYPYSRLASPSPWASSTFHEESEGCTMCGSRSEIRIRGRTFCQPCATRIGGIPGVPQPRPRSTQPSAIFPSYRAPISTSSLSSREIQTPRSSQLYQARWPRLPPGHQGSPQHTPLSARQHVGQRPTDRRSAQVMVPPGSSSGGGRRRAATVSGNGPADELAHPSATVHLQVPQPPQPPAPRRENSYHSPIPPSRVLPTSAAKKIRIRLSPSPPRQIDKDGRTGRRATISGSPPRNKDLQTALPSLSDPVWGVSGLEGAASVVSPVVKSLPRHGEFMEKAQWIWGVLDSTSRLLGELELDGRPEQ